MQNVVKILLLGCGEAGKVILNFQFAPFLHSLQLPKYPTCQTSKPMHALVFEIGTEKFIW